MYSRKEKKMKSKIKKLLVTGLVLASFSLMGCEPDKDAEGPVSITVKDADGNEYPTVKIGQQIWMAKNLNVNVPGSVCYENKPENCEKYGRLYTWEAAKEVCPSGWRLPRKKDFKILLNKVGSSEQERSKNLRTTSWNNGTDKYGFSVLPAGVYGFDDESFTDLGDAAFFWSSAEDHSYLIVGNNSSYIYYLGSKNDGHSVRCIQDN